jgi:hypothetical protein
MNQNKDQQHGGQQHGGGQHGGKDDQRQGGQEGGQHTPVSRIRTPTGVTKAHSRVVSASEVMGASRPPSGMLHTAPGPKKGPWRICRAFSTARSASRLPG